MNSLSPLSSSFFTSPRNRSQSFTPGISNWSDLPEKLLNDFITLTLSQDPKQVATLHLVCRTWRTFIINNANVLRPQNLHNLPLYGPRFPNSNTLIITERACDQTQQLCFDSSTQHIPSNPCLEECFFFQIKPALNLAPFAIFNNLIYLNVENNRYIDDESFQTLKWLPALSSLNAAGCGQLIDLCDLRGNELMALKLSRCRQLSDLALQRIADCYHLQSLNLADSGSKELGYSVLSSLKELTILDLSKKFPSSCASITALSTLQNLAIFKLKNMGGVSLLFEKLTTMTKLSSLSLRNSHLLHGDLSALSNLINLSALDISLTSFVYLPKLIQLKSLRKLTQIILNSCQFSNLEELADLTQLQHIKMKNITVLEGNSLKSLSRLTNLQLLDLAGSNLQKMNFEGILSLNNLTHLNLFQYSKQRYRKKNLDLPRLKHLNLCNWQVNKSLVTKVAMSTHLTYLNLSKSNLRNQDLRCFAHLTQLIHLNINSCFALNGKDLATLMACQKLEHLFLSKSIASAQELSFLTHLQHLKTLDLSFCSQIGNEIFQTIGQLSELSALNLRSTSITSLLSQTLEDLHLQALDISCCQIGASDLSHVANIKELRHLTLSNTSMAFSMIPWFEQYFPKIKLTLIL